VTQHQKWKEKITTTQCFFSQGADQKNMSYYLYKGTFDKKKWPQVAMFPGENV
jgi:hypothetical protein